MNFAQLRLTVEEKEELEDEYQESRRCKGSINRDPAIRQEGFISEWVWDE
ncbi:hypothetical protein [Thalassomonas haliotis]|uniref:Transposase n=1 Tax=Thalassomonas haliotis TaxID=485448 RepID=A0ABY7VDS7_9GAMM|nr:hypothetical protein [Thalassomonas haliotis]WDE11698.1 hypothetical protein H3N35_26470 [Thalassomonas haliotis]